MFEEFLKDVAAYYSSRISECGATPQGVDWNGEASQKARFHQLIRVMDGDLSASVLDFGCGYGALLPFLRQAGWKGHYEGVDIAEAMIDEAKRLFEGDSDTVFTVGTRPRSSADYVIASGIFNVKLGQSCADWEQHVYQTIKEMVENSRKGIACNFLTAWSDQEKMRDDLFYAAPEKMLAFCASNFSRWIDLSHDYGLFEFTVRMHFDRRFSNLRSI
jgi:SAM-dependent methyltransferase